MLTSETVDTTCMSCFAQLEAEGGICPICGYDEATQDVLPHQLRPRTILNGKYLLGKVLGEGGFGITYIGWDLNLDIKVAIKEYYPNGIVTRDGTTTVFPYTGGKTESFTSGRDRFIKEAKNLAKFYSLPGIVSVKDYFPENGTAYIVMEFVEGKTLKAILAESGGKLPVAQVLNYMKPVIRSLHEVHSAGMIHRDISPDNIIITKEGNSKLIDFGAARGISEEQQSLSVLLKPGFAPLEQYQTRGVQGAWTDIYALCATIYRAITGVIPDEAMERIQRDALQPPRAFGAVMTQKQENAILKGLAVHQTDRFLSVMELYGELYGDADHEFVPISPVAAAGYVSAYPPQQPGVGSVSAYPPQQPGVGSVSTYPLQQPGVGPVPAYPPQQSGVGPASAYPLQQPVSNLPSGPSPKWSTRNKVVVSICACVIGLVCLSGLVVFLSIIGRGGKNDDRTVLSNDTKTEANTKTETNTQPETNSTSEEPQTITIAGETISVDVTELDLIGKNLDDISVLAELTNLESLDISFNYDISDISALSELTNLKSLDISYTDISDISALAGLTNLEKLSCNFTEVSDIQALKNLTNLTSLEIYYNNISDISALAGLTNLTNLDVDSNNISDISVLAGLTMLDYLNLNNNPLTQNQVDELQDALPYCYIAATGLTASVPVAVDLTNDEIFAILEDQVYNEEIKEIVPDITYTLDSGMKIQLLEYARVSYDDEYDAVVYRINVSCVSGQAALEENDFMLLHDLDGTQETPYLDAPYVVGDMLTEEGLTFPIALSQEPKELAIGFLIPSAATDAAFVCTNILNGTSAGPMYLYVTFDAIE
jgi:serine/threonine protein kinase